MAKRTIRIPGLYGGISHQPDHMRHVNQTETATNVVLSVVDGMSKRPGSEYVAVSSGFTTGDSLRMHPIKRDGTEKYLILYGAT